MIIPGGLKGKKHLHMMDFPASHVWFPEGMFTKSPELLVSSRAKLAGSKSAFHGL